MRIGPAVPRVARPRTGVVPLAATLVAAVTSAVVISSPAALATSASAEATPSFVPDACPESRVPADVREALANARCGFLEVPENRTSLSSPTIRLQVAIFPAASPTPAPDPLVYMAGGPGNAAILHSALLIDVGFNRDRDLIILAQRGTLFSRPNLACPEIDRFNARAVGLDHNSASTKRKHLAATRACRGRLVANGVDLGAYNTTENAADFADLRTALGIPEWNVFGVSYGTNLALSYMRNHPQGIRSVTIASVAPPSVVTLGWAWTSAAEGFRNLFRACKAQPRCTRRYPHLGSTFARLVRELEAQPLTTHATPPGADRRVKVVIDGIALVNWLVEAVDHEAAGVPAAIDDLAQGDPRRIAESLAEGAFPEVGVEALGLAYGVACSEDAAYERPSEILRKGRRAFPMYPTSVLRHAPQFTFWTNDCRIWNVPKAPISQREITVSAIPSLVMSGTFDAKTGAQWGRYAAQTLSNSTVARFPGIGHAVISSSACARAVFASFLATPSAPDVGCVADVKPAPFEITDP